MEALTNSSVNQSEPGKNRGFCLAHKINRLQRSILATRPCVAGASELIRGSLYIASGRWYSTWKIKACE